MMDFTHHNSVLVIIPGMRVFSPHLKHPGSPTDHIHLECLFETGSKGGRTAGKVNTNQISQLERTIRDIFLIRP